MSNRLNQLLDANSEYLPREPLDNVEGRDRMVALIDAAHGCRYWYAAERAAGYLEADGWVRLADADLDSAITELRGWTTVDEDFTGDEMRHVFAAAFGVSDV